MARVGKRQFQWVEVADRVVTHLSITSAEPHTTYIVVMTNDNFLNASQHPKWPGLARRLDEHDVSNFHSVDPVCLVQFLFFYCFSTALTQAQKILLIS